MHSLRITVNDRPNQLQPFHPGSSVTGSLSVTVNGSDSHKRISIQFLGRERVQWTERRDGGGRPGSGVCIAPYTSSHKYIDEEQTLWTADQSPDGRLSPGQHSFPFCFYIPDVPSSFEGTLGSIRYTLVGRVSWTPPLRPDAMIQVRIPVHVQQVVGVSDPRLLQPVRQEVQKTVCCLCCASAPIELTVTVPKTGYCIGETLPVRITIENGSSRRITLTASLYQNVEYTAKDRHKSSKTCLVSDKSDEITPHITCDWNCSLQIPATDVLDEQSYSNIKVSHSLEIAANIPCGFNLSTVIPLKLGNVREQWNTLLPQPIATPQCQPPPYPHGRPPPYTEKTPLLSQAAPTCQTP